MIVNFDRGYMFAFPRG